LNNLVEFYTILEEYLQVALEMKVGIYSPFSKADHSGSVMFKTGDFTGQGG
jgi:hypothetical protein